MALSKVFSKKTPQIGNENEINSLHRKVKYRPKLTTFSYSEEDTNIVGCYLSDTSAQYLEPKARGYAN